MQVHQVEQLLVKQFEASNLYDIYNFVGSLISTQFFSFHFFVFYFKNSFKHGGSHKMCFHIQESAALFSGVKSSPLYPP